MKSIKTNIFLFAMFAVSPLTAFAQSTDDVADEADTTIVAKKKTGDHEIWEKALLEAGNKKCDWTDKAYIKPILEALR